MKFGIGQIRNQNVDLCRPGRGTETVLHTGQVICLRCVVGASAPVSAQVRNLTGSVVLM